MTKFKQHVPVRLGFYTATPKSATRSTRNEEAVRSRHTGLRLVTLRVILNLAWGNRLFCHFRRCVACMCLHITGYTVLSPYLSPIASNTWLIVVEVRLRIGSSICFVWNDNAARLKVLSSDHVFFILPLMSGELVCIFPSFP